ncbi:MAG: hypothetical protein V7647_147 [Acidobacteriota bacterium]|jgi:hypothetical protein
MRTFKLACAAALSTSYVLAAQPAAGQRPPLPGEVRTDGGCSPGLIWRQAFTGDHLCVTPAARRIVALDNMSDRPRHRTGFAGVILAECLEGFVWRDARPGDTVCVSPAERAVIAHDNAVAASRAPLVGALPPAAPASVYRTGGWSPWISRDGVQYRYRWGWDPAVPAFARTIDALFEINNQTAAPWKGNARAWSCSGTLGSNQAVVLAPSQHATISFKADNCGSLEAPFFKGAVVRSSTY